MSYVVRNLMLAVAATSCLTAVSRASQISFAVDPTQSALSLTSAGPVTMQGAESWSTSYSGSLVVELTDSTIEFLPQSTLTAGNSGSWQPGLDYPTTGRAEDDLDYVDSDAPANYGSITDLSGFGGPTASNSAVRNVQLSLDDTAARPLVGDTFSAAGIIPDFLSGTVYYSYGSTLPSGPITNLAGEGIAVSETVDAAGEASLVRDGDLLTLTLPVQFDVSYFLSNLTYSGTIVGTANVPEPNGVVFLLSGASVLCLFRTSIGSRHSRPRAAMALPNYSSNAG